MNEGPSDVRLKARAKSYELCRNKKNFLKALFSSQVYLQQIKKKAEAESKNCHAKTMLSLEKPIKLI